MTAVAQEMLELADKMRKERAMLRFEYSKALLHLSALELELIEIALRESALSRNEVVGERMI